MHHEYNVSSGGEKSSLHSLNFTLRCIQDNTIQMMSKLERFEDGLKGMDDEMQPFQLSTQNYSLAKTNIGQYLIEV